MSELRININKPARRASAIQQYRELAPTHTFDELIEAGMQPRGIKRAQNVTNIDYLPPRKQNGQHYAVTLTDYYRQQAPRHSRNELLDLLKCSVARLKYFEKVTGVSHLTRYSVTVNGQIYADSTDAYIALAPKCTADELSELLSVKRPRVSALYKKTGVDYVHQESVQVAGEIFNTHNDAFKFLAKHRTPDEIAHILNVSRRQVYHIRQDTGVSIDIKAYDPVHRWTASEIETFYKVNAPHKNLEALMFDTRGQLTKTMAQDLAFSTGIQWQPIVTIDNVPFDDRQIAYNMFKHKYTNLELANIMGLTVLDIEKFAFQKGSV